MAWRYDSTLCMEKQPRDTLIRIAWRGVLSIQDQHSGMGMVTMDGCIMLIVHLHACAITL